MICFWDSGSGIVIGCEHTVGCYVEKGICHCPVCGLKCPEWMKCQIVRDGDNIK